eukprot:scaffold18716_cov128-Isochrysis_galbana.AAC.5
MRERGCVRCGCGALRVPAAVQRPSTLKLTSTVAAVAAAVNTIGKTRCIRVYPANVIADVYNVCATIRRKQT